MSRWEPAYLKDISAWIRNPNIPMYGRWNQPASKMEGGVDVTAPGGTPVLALADGPIVGAGYFCHSPANFAMTSPTSAVCYQPGYGVVTQRINVPGYGMQDLYYQHIDIHGNIRPVFRENGTQSLRKGDIVGYVRANVGEIEMGFNARWGTIWGIHHPGPWATDPRPLIKALMDAGPPGTSNANPQPPVGSPYAGAAGLPAITDISLPGPSTYVPMLEQVHETLINHPGFYGIALSLDEAEQFPGYIDLTQPVKVDTAVGTFDVPDVTGTARSVGATVADNFLPFAIRSGLVLLGAALVFALVVKPVMQVAGPVAEVLA